MNKNPLWHPYTTPDFESVGNVVSARGSLLYLEDGKVVIDAIGSWWTSVFGHCYPPLVETLSSQAHELDHVLFGDLRHPPATSLAHRLLTLLGDGKIIFSDNGSTSVETALKLAIQWQTLSSNAQKNQFASFEGGYHGDTIGAMSLQGENSLFCQPYRSLLRPVIQVPFVDTWDGDETVEEREREALKAVDVLLDEHASSIACFIFEPLIQGSAGMKMCRPQYLEAICQKMRERNILLIADEVMTGLGRTGALFGSHKAGVHPDMMCISKALAGGMLPLAATYVRQNLIETFVSAGKNGILFHGHTFSGNPIACKVAEKTIELLCENSALFSTFQERYMPYLEMCQNFTSLRNARAMGAVFAVDIATKSSYGSSFSTNLRKKFWDRGVLARPLGSTIYFLPAYTFSKDALTTSFDALWDIAKELL